MNSVQQQQYAIMEWLDDGNKLSIHHLKHVVDPVKSWNDYKTGDIGSAVYPGTGENRWKFKIHGVADFDGIAACLRCPVSDTRCIKIKDLQDLLKNIISERESGNLNVSGQQVAPAPKRKKSTSQQPEKKKAKKTLSFESDEEEDIDPLVLKSAYKSAVETVLSVRRRPQSQGKEVLAPSPSLQTTEASLSSLGPESTLPRVYPPTSSPRFQSQNLNSEASLSSLGPESTLPRVYPPTSSPGFQSQNLNSEASLSSLGPESTLPRVYPPTSSPRFQSQNLNSEAGLTSLGPESTLPRVYPPTSSPRFQSQNLNSEASLSSLGPESTLPRVYPPTSSPRFQSQNLNSEASLSSLGPESTLPRVFPPTSSPRFQSQNLNSEASLSSLGPESTLPRVYPPTSSPRFQSQNLNSEAELTLPASGTQSFSEPYSDSNYMGNVGVTGSADYIDLDAPTSSLVQGAYSTLYPDEMGASTTQSCHSCCDTVKQLVNEVTQVREELDKLKRKLKKSKSDGDRPDVTEETTYNGYSKQQLIEMVSNLKSPTDAIKCLFKTLFSVGELTTSSVTGKKTVKGDAKDGLQESRRQCVEAIIQEKFPEMALKDIRNKMRDRLKLFRRSHLPPPTATDKTN